jgi:hypothetical protein
MRQQMCVQQFFEGVLWWVARELQNPWINRILYYGIKEDEMIKRIVRYCQSLMVK